MTASLPCRERRSLKDNFLETLKLIVAGTSRPIDKALIYPQAAASAFATGLRPRRCNTPETSGVRFIV